MKTGYVIAGTGLAVGLAWILVAEPTPAPPVLVTTLPSQIVSNIERIAEGQVRRDRDPWFTLAERIEVLAGIDLVL